MLVSSTKHETPAFSEQAFRLVAQLRNPLTRELAKPTFGVACNFHVSRWKSKSRFDDLGSSPRNLTVSVSEIRCVKTSQLFDLGH